MALEAFLQGGPPVERKPAERVAHLLGSLSSGVVEALRSRVPVGPASQEPDWTRAHPYVLTHLASHAFKAGVLGELTADGMFIAAAEPLRTPAGRTTQCGCGTPKTTHAPRFTSEPF